MNLALLEDLIAAEDVADVAEVGPLLRWLDERGLLDTSRLRACRWCTALFLRPAGQPGDQVYCRQRCADAARNWPGDPSAGPGQACRGCRTVLPWSRFPKHATKARYYRFCFACRSLYAGGRQRYALAKQRRAA